MRRSPYLERAVDIAIAAVVGSPARAIVVGAALLYAIGGFLGWWFVGALAVATFADLVWCSVRLPRRWRPW